MCGIYGVVDFFNGIGNPERYESLSVAMKHRGPDAFGCFSDNHVFLGHNRLSIIDLSTGNQPIFNEDESKCIIFNGEIFNYQEINLELKKLGHAFKTHSDTETILHAYEEWGPDCLDKFRGMFAFTIYDSIKKRVFIARDRLGIKPLYYVQDAHRFYFSSEIKTLLALPEISREIDQIALSSYFFLSYIPAPLSIFKSVRKLEPGHHVTFDLAGVRVSKYWDVHFMPDHQRSEKEMLDSVESMLEESVKLRMVSDVPVGGFLSGGIDSGLVVAMMSKFASTPIQTFCMGFGGEVGGYLDERSYARLVADRYSTNHSEFEVQPNIEDIFDEIITSFDEPFADHSTIPSYFLCRETSKKVKVAVSGLGGDELFGGYERYLGYKLTGFYNKIPVFARNRFIRPLVNSFKERSDGHYTLNHLKRFVSHASEAEEKRYLGFVSNHTLHHYDNPFLDSAMYSTGLDYCETLFGDLYNSPNAKSPLDKIFYCDMKTYLPEDILACTDRISMRHSLEVRVPFLDHKLLEYAATIPDTYKIRYTSKKYLLKKISKDYLPETVINHRKQGFVGPLNKWLQTDLKDYVINRLTDKASIISTYFRNDVINGIVYDHFSGKNNNDKFIWSLLVFQRWYEKYMGK